MKRPILNEFERLLIREETLEGARLLIRLANLKLARETNAGLIKIINYLNPGNMEKEMNREERQKAYAGVIYGAIADAIHNEDIKELSMQELKDSEKLTDFIFVTSSMIPAIFHGMLTGENVDMIEMTHIANRLAIQNLLDDQKEGKLKFESEE